MANATSKLCLDERWGGHLDIGHKGNVVIPMEKKLNYYTVELWIRLKKYPIIRSLNKSQVMISPTLLSIGNVRVTYNETKIAFKDLKTQQSVHVNYPAGIWFQLAITNGKADTLGYDMGSIYIDGKQKENYMIFPADIDVVKIGNDLKQSDKILVNLNYPSES